ncbi:MAG: hypothetical protein ACK46K_02375 [Gammaproteobacteria bacterium]
MNRQVSAQMLVIPADILPAAVRHSAAIMRFDVLLYAVCGPAVDVLAALSLAAIDDRAVMALTGF